MDLIAINQQTCNKDGICAAVCPAGIIKFEKDEYPTPSDEAEKLCIKCGHCVAACPTSSFSHREIPAEQCPSIRNELMLTDQQCEHFLRSRRSIRVYKKKPVPRDSIQKLIEIARYAPSGHNSQGAEWLVIDNIDHLQKLAAIVADWMRWLISNKPDTAASMHMDRTVKRWENGTDVYLRNAPALAIAHAGKDNSMARSTCYIALTYLEIAATSMGLGCCWAGYFNAAATNFEPMINELPVPEDHQCYGSMMIGYSRYKYYKLPPRRTPSITWHE